MLPPCQIRSFAAVSAGVLARGWPGAKKKCLPFVMRSADAGAATRAPSALNRRIATPSRSAVRSAGFISPPEGELLTPLLVVENNHHIQWCQLSQNLRARTRQTCANLLAAGARRRTTRAGLRPATELVRPRG